MKQIYVYTTGVSHLYCHLVDKLIKLVVHKLVIQMINDQFGQCNEMQ